MSENEKLVERLESWVRRDPVESPYDLIHEAAAALTTAEARVKMLEAQVTKLQDGATLAGLLDQADDVWTDYGSGFRIHFSFLPSHESDVILRINRRRCKARQALTGASDAG